MDDIDVQKISEKNNAKKLEIRNGNISFENVKFSYYSEESKILKSINLIIPGEKMTALVGHSGAGKSTIMNLIPRFYDCNSGDIKIDNQSIYKTSLSSLRSNISIVTTSIVSPAEEVFITNI